MLFLEEDSFLYFSSTTCKFKRKQQELRKMHQQCHHHRNHAVNHQPQRATWLLFLLTTIFVTFSWNLSLVDSLSNNHLLHQLPSYETKIACEGGTLELNCVEGTKISLIRANFGRFSIVTCNPQGYHDLPTNCMSRRSFRVIQEICGNRSECTLFANAVYFGDPCPTAPKYLEVQYHCLPESFKPSSSPPVLASLPVAATTSNTANVNNNNVNVKPHHLNNNNNNRDHKPTVVTSVDINNSNQNSSKSVNDVRSVSSTPSSLSSSTIVISSTSDSDQASSSSTTTTTVSSTNDVVSQDPSSGLFTHDRSGSEILNSRDNPFTFQRNNKNTLHTPSTSFGSNDDDYDGTTSPLDSDDDHSTSSSPSSSSTIPLSEPLRLLLTVGCVFGIICLFLTMLSLVMSVFPSNNSSNVDQLQQQRSMSSSTRLEVQVKQNLTLCLLVVQVLFMMGINMNQSRFFCGIISSTLHYFFLSIFIWLFFDGFTLYLALLKNQESSSTNNDNDIMINHVNNPYSQHQFHLQRIPASSSSSPIPSKRPCKIYLLIAYGLPLVIQILASLMDNGSIMVMTTNPVHCWLRSDKYVVLTFVGPVIAVLSANFLFLAITVVCSNYGSLFSLDNNHFSVNSLNNINKAYSEQSGVVGHQEGVTSTGRTMSPLRIRLRTSLAVFVVMSLSLTALFVSLCQELPGDEVVFTSCLYVFSILNPIQVLVIFVLFSSSSSMAKQNSVKVLTSLGFLESSKSISDHHNNLQSLSASNSRGFKDSNESGMIPQEPIIPSLPHSSNLNIASASMDQQQQQQPQLLSSQQSNSDAMSVGQGSKSYASDYGFRGNRDAAASSALNYRSPVYGSHAANASNQQLPSGVYNRTTGRSGHIHTKECLQFPCQYPHVVEHVYESIDEDPYVRRLLVGIPTPLTNRKGHQGSQNGILPAIIRDNTNHSTIICSPGSGVVTTTTTAVRASMNKNNSLSHLLVGHNNLQYQQQSTAVNNISNRRHESTLIWSSRKRDTSSWQDLCKLWYFFYSNSMSLLLIHSFFSRKEQCYNNCRQRR